MQPLLFLVHRIPYPPTKGDKVRSYHLLRYMASRYRVYLGAFVDDEDDLQHARAVKDLCEDCHLVRLNPVRARIRSLIGLLSDEPLTLHFYRSASMRNWVERVLREIGMQRVLVFSSAMAQYAMTATRLRRVADLVDVDSDKWRQYAATHAWPWSALYRRESRVLLRYETDIARKFDAAVFVSAAEAGLFRTLAPSVARNVRYANNGVDCKYFSPERTYTSPYAEGARVIVFTGAMDYRPNIDAVIWFARVVFPKILLKCPDARFYVVGARPVRDVASLAGQEGVCVTGTVSDVRPYIAHSTFAVAPLRIARGVQNKVLEAMAMAKAVLATPQAAEGLELRPGAGVLVADTELEFAERALQLLRSNEDATSIGAAGREHVLASYDWGFSLSKFEELLEAAGGTLTERPPESLVQQAISGRSVS